MKLLSARSPIVRLSLVLVMLTCGLLLLCDFVGLFPHQYAAMLNARKVVAETIAIQTVAAVESESVTALDKVFEALVKRDSSLLSIALRKQGGEIVASAGNHALNWQLEAGKTSTETQVRVPIFNGSREWGTLELAFAPIGIDRTGSGIPRSFLVVLLFVAVGGFIANLAFLRRALSELDPSAVVPQRVRAALDALAEGLVIIDQLERIVLANTSFARKLGRTTDSLVGVALSTLGWRPADGADELPELPWRTVIGGREPESGRHMCLVTSGGQTLTFALHAVGVTAADGAVRGALVTFDDLTNIEQTNAELRRTLAKLEGVQRELARQNQELQVLATRDPLSGALNRRALFEAFENLLRDARVNREELICIMVDIDKFKTINDRYGHGVGDKVIRDVARILDETARTTDLVARYGGEEFCVLLPNTGMAQARTLAERIRRAIQDGGGAGFNTPMQITASLGIASSAHEAADPNELCNQADQALYVAKESGRNKVVAWPEVAAYLGMSPAKAEPAADEAAPVDGSTAAANAGLAVPVPMSAEPALAARIAQLERALRDSESARAGILLSDPDGALPNWHILKDRIDQALSRMRRANTHLAVMAIEIASYRDVNVAMGIACSERLIGAINQRLRENLREGDTISLLQCSDPGVVLMRFGNDEFVLVLTDLEDPEVLPRIIARMVETLTPAFEIDGMELFIAPQFGVAVAPDDGANAVSLVANANAALRHVRQRHGELPYRFYSSEMNSRARESLQREAAMRHAIERHEFVLHYQPRVDVASGSITGVEALIRWNHPTLGIIMPDQFIPMAERLRLIDDIGEWVIATACRQLAEWTRLGHHSIGVAVNVSPIQMRNENILRALLSNAIANGIAPERIEIEVTESVVINNFDSVVPLMNDIAAAGFQIALDDFGTGYSSLSYLRRFPLHRLKIDRSFLAGLGENATDYAIVNSIIEMAHSLDIRVVAEGVETEAQWEALRDAGCDEVQGYLLSRPGTVEDIAELLDKGAGWRRKMRLIQGSATERAGERRVAIKGILNDATTGKVSALMRESIGSRD